MPLIDKVTVDEYKLHAIKVLHEVYIRTESNQPLWVSFGEPSLSYLDDNCLPAHFAILPEVKKKAPKAGVVIGVLGTPVLSKLNEVFNNIANMNPFEDDDANAFFHAWIRLNIDDPNSEIIDITSNPAKYSAQGYLNKPLPRGHIEVLTKQSDVYHFHAKYTYWKFSKNRYNHDVKKH
ncbi:hypothetical protein [Vibrio taketomensis]|uniref:hypothetical protein n=1 Tax=Vibrio taketomensis TaxID=2572923 RepID=UPI0013895412|nr:hypothetical protein [Vibrio taketomensis]